MRKSTFFGIILSSLLLPGVLVDSVSAQVAGGTGSDTSGSNLSDIGGGNLSDIGGFNVFSESPMWNEITGPEIPPQPTCPSCNLRRFGIGKPQDSMLKPRRFTLKFTPNRSCPAPKSCNPEELKLKYLQDLRELEKKAEALINNRLW
ncbi:MAG: hypothetical protein AAFY21_04885 [Cyanobacteria bacterium J06641_2]